MRIIMHSKNSLAIFGDSFADAKDLNPDVSGEPWCFTLAKLLDLKYKIYAKCGTSIWWSFSNFLKYYKDFSHIVFVYSQHNRWHFLQKEYETMHNIIHPTQNFPDKTNEKDKVAKLLLDVYPIVNSEDFDLYVYQKIFNDVNQICKDNNIKLINFMPFDNGKLIDYSNQYGFCIYNAIDLIKFEQQQLTDKEQAQFVKMLHDADHRYCHMNWKNNKMVATRMFENVNNITDKLDILKDNEVSSDPDCIKEILNMLEKRLK